MIFLKKKLETYKEITEIGDNLKIMFIENIHYYQENLL